MYVVQSPRAETPSVELARSGSTVVLPLVEARNVGDAVESLLVQAGLAGRLSEPGS